jgi:hypothetical protein
MNKYQTGDLAMDNFLTQVEQCAIPAPIIINKMLELISKLADKDMQLNQLSKAFSQFQEVNRKIDEIHKLHFCREYILEKGKKNSVSQRDKFMAQILLEPVRKRK